MAPSDLSRANFRAPSGDDDMEGPSDPPGPSVDPSTQEPNPAAGSVPKYSEQDLQRIMKTVLESRPSAPAPRDFDEPRERPLKPRAPDVYKGKSHMDCYNFIQQCEDYFAMSGATCHNRVPFAAGYLKDRAMNRWQQHKRKIGAETLVPITWNEFKVFLRKSLGETRVFVDTIWHKLRTASQYQLEDVMDWSVYLEHLQAVLKEFDVAAAPADDLLIRYFRDGLRPSIRAQMDERDRDLADWQEVIERAVDAEAKAACQAPSLAQESDARDRKSVV